MLARTVALPCNPNRQEENAGLLHYESKHIADAGGRNRSLGIQTHR